MRRISQDVADSIRLKVPDQTHRRVSRDTIAQTKCVCKQGDGVGTAVAGNHILATPLDRCTLSGLCGIQVAQEQFADWRIETMQ
jgi:hypothetical protein